MLVHRVVFVSAALYAAVAWPCHPQPPLNLAQSAGGSPLATGGTVGPTTPVSLTANKDPATCGSDYRLEYEIRLTSQAWTNTPTHFGQNVPSTTCSITYTYPALSVTLPTGTYKWQVREHVNNGCGSPPNQTESTWVQFNAGLAAFTVTGVQITPAAASYGTVRVGQTSPAKTFEVTNGTTGNVTINTASISSGAPFTILSSPSLPATIASGAKATFTISAAPMSTGTHNGTFTVTSTATNSPHSAALTVIGGLPVLALPAASVSFGDVGINGVGKTLDLTINNTGNAALTLLSGSVAAPFSVSGLAGLTVAPGQSEKVKVTYAPTALGSHSGTLTIASDDPNSPHTVSLDGTGIDPKVTLGVASIAFPNTVINATSTAVTVTLSNTGTGTLVMGTPTVTGPFTTTLAAGSLAAGSSTTFDVAFAPTTPGAKTGAVIIPSNDGASPKTLPLSGFAEAPVASPSPAAHSYGTVALGSTQSVNVTLTNSGDSTLNVSALGLFGSNTSEFALQGAPTVPFSLAPSASQMFSVEFTPARVGIRSAELVLQSDRFPPGPLVIPLSGTGDGAQISLAPAAIEFGALNVGETTDRTFVVGNSGTLALTVSGLTFGGTASADYSTSKATPFTVAPGATSSVTVTFAPSVVGLREAELAVASSDALAPTAPVEISGTGMSPQLSVTPSSLSFGSVRAGQSLTRSVSLANTGNGPLSIDSLSIGGQDAARFTLVNGGAAFVLAPGAPAKVITVRFAPSSVGASSADLMIASDDPATPDVNIPLAGEGVAPGLTLSANEVNFGGQPVGRTSAPRSFTVTNSGTAPMQVTGVALTGASAAAYAIASPLGGFAIPPGGQKEVLITVAPKDVGELTARAVVTTDVQGAATAEVDLAALGISDVFSVSQSALSFGAAKVGSESAPKEVALSSAAADPLPLGAPLLTGTGARHFTVELSEPSVPGAGSVTATVRYRPLSAGAHTAEVVLTTTAAQLPPVRIAVMGSAVSRVFDASPATVEYGVVEVGSSLEQTVTLTNKTASPVTITGFALTSGEFAATTGTPLVVEPGGEARVAFTFSPSEAHQAFASAAVLVDGAQATDPAITVQLAGTGSEQAGCSAAGGSTALWAFALAALALLFRRGRAALARAVPGVLAVAVLLGGGSAFGVSVTPTTVSFNIVRVGNTSAGQTVQVVNNSAVAVELQAAAVSGPFAISAGDTLPLTLNASGGTSTWTLTATPTATGVQTGTFSVTTDEQTAPFVANLTVTGGLPDLVLPPAVVSMGEATVNGAAVSKNVTLQNQGNLPLVIGSATGSGAFSASGLAGVTVGAGLSHTFQVSFAPTTAGQQTGSITITSDDPDSPHTLSATGLGSSPQLSLGAPSVVFPDTLFSASSQPVTVTLSNTGVGTLAIGAPTVTGPFTTSLSAGQLASGASTSFTVTFTPGSPGAKTGSISIPSNDAASPATLSLSGFARAPQLSSSPASHDFGQVALGVSQTAILTLSNPGDIALNVSALSLTGANAGDFSVQGAPSVPFAIPSGGSTQLSVRFAPGAAGARAAQLDLSSDRHPTGTFSVPLTGTGAGPRIQVTACAVPPCIPAVQSLDFGFVVVGASQTRSMEVENTGSTPLTVSGLTFSTGQPADYVASEAVPFTLQPAAKRTISVTLTPSAVGSRNSKLTVASDDPLSPGVDVPLLGSGVAPSISVSPSSINFGAIRLGQENTRTVTVTNPGTGTLIVSAAVITGGDVSSYSVSSIGTGFSVPPNSPLPRSMTVKFKPLSVGATASTLVIVSNDPDVPQIEIPLTGEGVTPALALSTTAVSFGAQPVGRASEKRSFKIMNTGSAGLQVSAMTISGSSAFAFIGAQPSFSIPAKGEKEVFVAVTPKQAGEVVARVVIATDVPGVPQVHVNLLALGISDVLAVSQASLSFGAVKAKETGAPLQITLSNASAEPLQLAAPALGGVNPAHFKAELAAQVVPAHGTVVATVNYAPTVAGSHSAELTLGSSEAGVPSVKINLSGTALSQKLDAAPLALDFGALEIGSTSEQVITLTNKTDLPVVVDAFAFSDDAYSTPTQVPFTIPPGEETKVVIAFAPRQELVAVGTVGVIVDGDDPSAPEATVSLAGSGSEASGCSAGGGALALWALLSLAGPLLRRRGRGRD